LGCAVGANAWPSVVVQRGGVGWAFCHSFVVVDFDIKNEQGLPVYFDGLEYF
jgi:hypothetical protein